MEEEGIFVLSPLRKEFRWFRSRDSCICAVYYAVNRMENCDNSRFVTISSWMEWNRFVVFLFRRIILLCILGYVHFSRGSIGRDGSFEWNRFIWKNDKKLLLFPWISSYDKYDDLDREESRFKISCTSF